MMMKNMQKCKILAGWVSFLGIYSPCCTFMESSHQADVKFY